MMRRATVCAFAVSVLLALPYPTFAQQAASQPVRDNPAPEIVILGAIQEGGI
jgi:hypothetical protein